MKRNARVQEPLPNETPQEQYCTAYIDVIDQRGGRDLIACQAVAVRQLGTVQSVCSDKCLDALVAPIWEGQTLACEYIYQR